MGQYSMLTAFRENLNEGSAKFTHERSKVTFVTSLIIALTMTHVELQRDFYVLCVIILQRYNSIEHRWELHSAVTYIAHCTSN